MKTSISLGDFIECEALIENFTYEGRTALFEYFEDFERDTGEEVEFDPIAIRCDYTEYCNIKEFWGEYSKEEYQSLEEISNYTTVIEIPYSDSFIIQQF